MTFRVARRRRIVRLMVPVGPEFGFGGMLPDRGHELTGYAVLVTLM